MPSIDVVPFTEGHSEQASALIASFYGDLDGVHESYRTTLSTPRPIRPTEHAFAATRAGCLVGVLVPSGARIGIDGHVAVEDRRAVYRALYGAFAGASDASRYYIAFAIADAVGLETFFELGFGVDQIRGVVPLGAWDADPGPVEVCTATMDDLDELAALVWELQLFHTGPPMFGDLLMDEPSTRALVEQDLARPNGTVLKVVDGGRIVGLAAVGAEAIFPRSARIGMQVVTAEARGRGVGRALAVRAIGWARDNGFAWCEVGWTSSNPISDPFWRGLGFEPIRYTLSRKVR